MRALVVDSSSLQRRFVSWLLREFPQVAVAEAADGLVALDQLLVDPFVLVIMELRLPGLDGLTLVDKLRHTPGPNVACPLVVVSTVADETTQRRAQQLGVGHFLTKPVPATRLRDVVRELLQAPAASTAASDKRQVPRLAVPVTVHVLGGPPQALATADISPFGAFIVADAWPAIGTTGRMGLALPHLTAPLEVGFEVVHVRPEPVGELPRGFGVRFTAERADELGRLVRAFETPGP